MKWKEVYKNQISQAEDTLLTIEEEKVESLMQVLEACRGMIFFTGIGKNGHVAAKTASTFSSMNIRSIFVDPIDALHGGMSMVTDQDVVIAVSKSGCTGELYTFLEKLKEMNENIKIVLIHSNPDSTCKKFSSLDIEMSIENENDKFGIVPISSISVFTIFLQSIGVEMSYRNNITKNQFLSNHPGGSIGKLVL